MPAEILMLGSWKEEQQKKKNTLSFNIKKKIINVYHQKGQIEDNIREVAKLVRHLDYLFVCVI